MQRQFRGDGPGNTSTTNGAVTFYGVFPADGKSKAEAAMIR